MAKKFVNVGYKEFKAANKDAGKCYNYKYRIVDVDFKLSIVTIAALNGNTTTLTIDELVHNIVFVGSMAVSNPSKLTLWPGFRD